MKTIYSPCGGQYRTELFGKLRSYNNQPSMVLADGTQYWHFWASSRRKGPILDRNELDGPAVIGPDGRTEYYRYGRKHRITGPAKISKHWGNEFWVDGVRCATFFDFVMEVVRWHLDIKNIKNVEIII